MKIQRKNFKHIITLLLSSLYNCHPKEPNKSDIYVSNKTEGNPITYLSKMDFIAKKYGINIDQDSIAWLEFQDYKRLHGEPNFIGKALADGAIIGKDDWQTIIFSGEPTSEQRKSKLERERLYMTNLPERNAVSDARLAASEGDWSLFFQDSMLESGFNRSPWNSRRPMKFKVLGLENIYGCNIPEEQMKINSKMSLNKFYDIGPDFYGPLWHNGRVTGFTLIPMVLNKDVYKHDWSKGYEIKYNKEIFSLSYKKRYSLPLIVEPSKNCVDGLSYD